MITREQVKDLQPGDVVEISHGKWTLGSALRGPLQKMSSLGLFVGEWLVRHGDGRPNTCEDLYLTVISRAPRQLYVNHPRTEPVVGDVVRSAEQSGSLTLCWIYDGGRSEYGWHETSSDRYCGPDLPWTSRRLLVDGETGQVVR